MVDQGEEWEEGWLHLLSAEDRAELFRHFLAIKPIFDAIQDEAAIVPMEMNFGSVLNPARAIEVWKGFAASQRRQEGRQREIAEHFEAIVKILEGRFL